MVREEREVLQELERGIGEYLSEIIDWIPAENYQIPAHLQMNDKEALAHLRYFELEEGHVTQLSLFDPVKLLHLYA